MNSEEQKGLVPWSQFTFSLRWYFFPGNCRLRKVMSEFENVILSGGNSPFPLSLKSAGFNSAGTHISGISYYPSNAGSNSFAWNEIWPRFWDRLWSKSVITLSSYRPCSGVETTYLRWYTTNIQGYRETDPPSSRMVLPRKSPTSRWGSGCV